MFFRGFPHHFCTDRVASKGPRKRRWIVICADDFNFLGKDINTRKENTETLLDANKNIGVDGNEEETKYLFMSCYQNTGQSHTLKM
jgi:hypothetical protein